MFSAIKTLHQGVDVCINNAGLAHSESLLNGKTDGWRTMIDVGVTVNDLCVYVNCCPYLSFIFSHLAGTLIKNNLQSKSKA